MDTTYTWHEVYKAALLETEWSRMEERIRAAEAAIEQRKLELGQNGNAVLEESEAIAGAIRSLNVLRTEVASWFARQAKDAG